MFQFLRPGGLEDFPQEHKPSDKKVRFFTFFLLSPLLGIAIPLFYHWFNRYLNSGTFTVMSLFVIVITILFFVGWLFIKKRIVSISRIDLFFASFLSYIVVNRLFKDASTAYNDDLITLSMGICVYAMVRCLMTNDRVLVPRAVIYVALIVTTIQVLISYLQFFNIISSNSGLFKITGTYMNPSSLCSWFAIIYPICLFGTAYFNNKWNKVLIALICSSIAAITIFCVARMPLACIFLTTIFFFVNRIKNIKPIFYVIGIIIVGLLASLMLYLKSDSTSGRVFIWRLSSSLVNLHPLTGVGFGNFKTVYNLKQSDYFIGKDTTDSSFMGADENYLVYNDFLLVLIENGVLGLLIFLSLIFISLRSAFNIARRSRLSFETSLLCSLVSWLLISLISFPLTEPSLFYLFIFILAAISSSEKVLLSKTFSPSRKLLITGLFAFGLIIFSYSHYIHPVLKWYALTKRPYTKSLNEEFSKLYPKLNNNSFFLANYANNLLRNHDNPTALTVLQRAVKLTPSPRNFIKLGDIYLQQDNINEAENCYWIASRISPSKFLPLHKLLSLYSVTGNEQKSRSLAKWILKIPVKIPSAQIEGIRREAELILRSNNIE
jgi:O-antigen polymerase